MNTMKRRGSKIEPYGTPANITTLSEEPPGITTFLFFFCDKLSRNKSKRCSEIPVDSSLDDFSNTVLIVLRIFVYNLNLFTDSLNAAQTCSNFPVGGIFSSTK